MTKSKKKKRFRSRKIKYGVSTLNRRPSASVDKFLGFLVWYERRNIFFLLLIFEL